MKKFFLLAFTCFLSISLVYSQDNAISDDMSAFLQGSKLLQAGLKAQDKYLVADAADVYYPLIIEELSEDDFNLNNPEFISNPEIQYKYSFCQELRKNGFVLVEREPLDPMRAGIPISPINTISRSILPNGNASFTFEWDGYDNVEIAVPVSNSNLVIDVMAHDRKLDKVSSQSDFFYTTGEMHDGDKITVTLSNPTTEKISFCIAIR